MGRKKDQFIDKNKAITFKLSYRDNEDPFFQRQQTEGTNVERVFEIKSLPMDHTLTAEERKKRDKLLSLFTEEDQGIFEQKPKEPVDNRFWVPPEIRSKLAGKDLWIDQLAAKSQLNEQDVEDYEIEELEDVEEEVEEIDQDEEEYTEEEEGDDQEEEEIPTDKKQIQSKKVQFNVAASAEKEKVSKKKQEEQKQDEDTESEDYSYDGEEEDDQYDQNQNQEEDEEQQDKPKMEDLTSADFPDFKYKSLVEKRIVEENIIPKYDKITFSKDVKFKKFNEYGLPASNFDYSKYFVQPSQQNSGVVEAILLADYKTAPKLKEDIDYEYDEMTEEQREVFDALNFDEDDGYEELEDDFVQIANLGSKAIVKDLVEEEIEEKVNGKKKTKSVGKKMNFTFDHDGKIILDEENPLPKKKVVKKVIKKYKHADSKPSETSQEDKKFNQVMKEMEDSYDNVSGDEDYDIPELKEGILTGEGFNKILDDHIAGMSEHNKEVQQLEVKSKKKNVEFAERQQQRFEKYRGFGDQDEIVRRKLYEPVPLDQDNALKSYIEREIRREEDPTFQDENFDKPVGENKLDETIATKNFSFSKVHESLNVIGDDINLSRSKRYKKLRNADEDEEHAQDKKKKEEEIQQISEDEGEEEEEEEEKDPLKIRSYELSQKITRGETKEEKAARKQALKEFKEARKQKKKLIKEGFETLTKEHHSKIQNHTNHHNIQNIKGISIKSMM